MNAEQKKMLEDEETLLHKEFGTLNNIVWALKKVKKYTPVLLLLMAVGIITGSLMSCLWSFIGKYVLDIVQAQADTADKDIVPLYKLLAVIAVIEVVSLGLNALVTVKINYNFNIVRMKIMTERIAKSLSMNYETLENPAMLNTQEKAQRATQSSDRGVEGLIRIIYDSGKEIVLIAVSVSTIATLDVRLIAVLAIIAAIQAVVLLVMVEKDRKEVWEKLGGTWHKTHYMERVTQGFDWAKDIRLFNMKNSLSKKQSDILAEKRRLMYHSNNIWIALSLINGPLGILANAAVYGILIYSVIGSDMTIGSFTLYLGLAGTFSSSLYQLITSFGKFKERSMETDDFRSFTEGELGMDKDDEDYIPIPKSDTYRFEFKNVSYKYIGAKSYSLKNLSLTLEPGKKLAVVGINGAGKTTFIKLLLRLYDPTEGVILMNGIDIRRFKREEYYTLFSPVFQDVRPFAFPLSENVSMGTPEDTDKAYAEECLRKAGLGDKLDSLPLGVDTQLLKVFYEEGIDLSGGERQKLALVRALYKDAPIIVLDEPTAALDAIAEYNLYRSFNEIIGGKSAVYISHRLSSTRFCDTIAMFKRGEMIEYGTHEELLAENGAYAEMFAVQSQYYREDGELDMNMSVELNMNPDMGMRHEGGDFHEKVRG